MITLNTIVKRFEDFADNHFFIRSFSFGGPEDVDLDFFFNDTATTEIYTLSLHDALPIFDLI